MLPKLPAIESHFMVQAATPMNIGFANEDHGLWAGIQSNMTTPAPAYYPPTYVANCEEQSACLAGHVSLEPAMKPPIDCSKRATNPCQGVIYVEVRSGQAPTHAWEKVSCFPLDVLR